MGVGVVRGESSVGVPLRRLFRYEWMDVNLLFTTDQDYIQNQNVSRSHLDARQCPGQIPHATPRSRFIYLNLLDLEPSILVFVNVMNR